MDALNAGLVAMRNKLSKKGRIIAAILVIVFIGFVSIKLVETVMQGYHENQVKYDHCKAIKAGSEKENQPGEFVLVCGRWMK